MFKVTARDQGHYKGHSGQGSLAVFKVTARDQGHYNGHSGAFVTYCNISCFLLDLVISQRKMVYLHIIWGNM